MEVLSELLALFNSHGDLPCPSEAILVRHWQFDNEAKEYTVTSKKILPELT